MISNIFEKSSKKFELCPAGVAEKLGKSYNMVNGYVQNRQQPRLEVLNDIAEILDVDIKELIVSSR